MQNKPERERESKKMEKRRQMVNRGVEENMLAILDTSGFHNSKISHLSDDRLAFLEGVRTVGLLPDDRSSPTRKMFDAIFHILKDADSMDIIMESFRLLLELEKCFPRVYVSNEELESSSHSQVLPMLVCFEEVWLPFKVGMGSYNEKEEANSVDASGFHALIQEVARVALEMKPETLETTFLKNMLVLQYLITVLEEDFLPRYGIYQENMNWAFVKESLLNMLLGSRKIIYKSLVKDCLSIMCQLAESTVISGKMSNHEDSSGERLPERDASVALAVPQVKQSLCFGLKKLFSMNMELDSLRQRADQRGLTTRADGVRTPVVDIILDELIYDQDMLSSFLQVFDEPKQKLEIILQYFQKYIPKSSVQTRRSTGTVNAENFEGVLKCLSNSNISRNVIKKIGSEVVQSLLAYSFQAHLELSFRDVSEGPSESKKNVGSSSIKEVCRNVISAFTCLKQDQGLQISGVGKEAMLTAATILSTKM